MEEYLIRDGALNGGRQRLYRFPNGYGASVVQHYFSHGNEEGLWEMAGVKFRGDNNDDWDFFARKMDDFFNTDDDVIGRLDEEAIEYWLTEIKNIERGS